VLLFPIGLSAIVFLGGLISDRTPSPGTMLVLGDGRLNLDGLTLSSGARAGERDEAVDGRAFAGRRSLETGWTYASLLGGAPEDALDGDLETLETFDGARDGDRTGLAPLKKLDCLLTEAGDGGICASVSSVRSDNDGRISRRPRTSCVDIIDATSSSPAAGPASSKSRVSFSPPLASSCLRTGKGSFCGLGGDKWRENGFFTSVSYDGLRNLFSSSPGSARSLSREGDGLSDFDAVVVGKGNLEVSRGIPLAGRGIPVGTRVDVLRCPSILSSQLLMVFGRKGSRTSRTSDAHVR
jgi:hypothetical protein